VYKPGTPNFFVLVFENKCASLVSRCHCSVSHEIYDSVWSIIQILNHWLPRAWI